MELAALFAWSFLAATILPLGSEPALAWIVRDHPNIAIPICVATVGTWVIVHSC